MGFTSPQEAPLVAARSTQRAQSRQAGLDGDHARRGFRLHEVHRKEATMSTEARTRTPLAASTEHPSCDRCFHRRYCLPSAVENERWMQQVITGHSRVCKGGSLFRAGQPAAKVYVVHTGAFKSVICLPDGRQRIVSFHEAGDFMGLDAFTGQWGTDAIGLEASEACEIDIDTLDAVARQIPLLQRYLRRVISDRLVQAQQDQCALGTMHVTARM
ncbi:MAG: cyclic nucleotide-binding domain-containing protein, partial [Gallionella sp.]|nr:cyclic nucleotide-binding domain-containing protein [Gallionella sp.]